MDQLSWFNDLGMWDCLKQQRVTGGHNSCQICFSWTAPWHVEECYMAWVPTLPLASGSCQTGDACPGTGHSDRSQMPFMWQHQAPRPFSLTLWDGQSQASTLPELGGHANFLSHPLPPPTPHTCLIEACKCLRLSLCCWSNRASAWHSFLPSSGLQLAKTFSPIPITSICNSHVSQHSFLSHCFLNLTIQIFCIQ